MGNLEVVLVNVLYIDVMFWYKNEIKMRIYNFSYLIRIVFFRELVILMEMEELVESLFFIKKIMCYYEFDIFFYEVVVIVSI